MLSMLNDVTILEHPCKNIKHEAIEFNNIQDEISYVGEKDS